MMDVSALLERIAELGIEARVDGTALLLSPSSLVPEPMIPEIRTHKHEIIASLETDPGKSRFGRNSLIGWFRDGQAWLSAQRDVLDAMPDVGIGTEAERDYVSAIELLVGVETTLRLTCEYHGCVRGELGPCDPLAVVRCMVCAGMEEQFAIPGKQEVGNARPARTRTSTKDTTTAGQEPPGPFAPGGADVPGR